MSGDAERIAAEAFGNPIPDFGWDRIAASIKLQIEADARQAITIPAERREAIAADWRNIINGGQHGE